MGDKIPELPLLAGYSLEANDYIIVEHEPDSDAETCKMRVGQYCNNIPVLRTTANNITITNTWTPSSNSESCLKGKIGWDSNYLYIAVSNNHIKRVTLSVF